jgi:DNA gyrase subunit A
VITELGDGKRTPLEEYPVKGRNTQGVYTTNHRHLKDIGKIVDARVVQEEDQLTIITSAGIVLKIEVTSVSVSGRPTRGVHLMDVKDEDSVVSLARIQKLPERQARGETPSMDEEGEAEVEPDDEQNVEESTEEGLETDSPPEE